MAVRIVGNRYCDSERQALRLGQGALMLIERGDEHEIRNTGDDLLRTLNFYVPPAYTSER